MRGPLNRRRKWLLIAALGTLVIAVGHLYRPAVVVGDSMSPTLRPGALVWVDTLRYRSSRPGRGEVVLLYHEGGVFVKRVYRGPGEVIHYLATNGQWVAPLAPDSVEEMRQRCASAASSLAVETLQVPDDAVFVIGDNVRDSTDSRIWGPIPLRAVVGRVRVPVDASRGDPGWYRPRFTHSLEPRPRQP